MIRKSDKAALDICGRLDLRGVEYRRIVSVFSRIRRAHVRMFLDVMFGTVQDNHGFQGISHIVANRLDAPNARSVLKARSSAQSGGSRNAEVKS